MPYPRLYNKKINLYKNFMASRKMFKFIYLYIFQNKVKLSSGKYFWYTYVRDAVRCFSTRGSGSQDYVTVDIFFELGDFQYVHSLPFVLQGHIYL